MKELTIVMAVYGQPGMLAVQLDAIASYPAEVRARLNVVVVDDCGAPPVAIEPIETLATLVKSVKLLRVQKDIPWNQPGARNLGMHVSSGWCLMIDPDMVFDGATMARMLQAVDTMRRGRVMKWGLRHRSSGTVDMTSPNTWLIHRDDFFAIGGYDEAFCGHKGWSDVQLLDIFKATYKIDLRPDLCAEFYSTKDVSDAMVTSLNRNVSHNRKLRLKRVAQARACGGWAKWASVRQEIPRLNFPWKQLFPKA